jgi:hypothetical protein
MWPIPIVSCEYNATRGLRPSVSGIVLVDDIGDTLRRPTEMSAPGHVISPGERISKWRCAEKKTLKLFQWDQRDEIVRHSLSRSARRVVADAADNRKPR